MKRRLTGNDPTPRQFVTDILPPHYDVIEMIAGVIRCISRKGVEDESDWMSFMYEVRAYFGDAFKEVHHWTCNNHVDFTLYYSYHDLYNLTPEHTLAKRSEA